MSRLRELYVGIDVHRDCHKVAILSVASVDNPGHIWKRASVLTIKNNRDDFQRVCDAITLNASDVNQVAVAVDFTGGHYSEPLVYFLQQRGYEVCFLEAKATKDARERFLDQESKNDVLDAASIAYLLYLKDKHNLSFRISSMPFHLGSQSSTVRSLVLQREQFTKLATQTTNRLHQFLLSVFPEAEEKHFRQLVDISTTLPTPADILNSNGLTDFPNMKASVRKEICRLAAVTVGVPGNLYGDLIKDLSLQRREALSRRDFITDRLEKEVENHPYGRILLSFPSVSYVTAATVIGVIKDIDRWPDKKKFRKALGVYSVGSQSGTSMNRSRKGKEGSRHGRRALFQICLGHTRRDNRRNDFKDYYLRSVAKGKVKKKALVATMGKVAEIMFHCLKENELYEYQGKCESKR